MSHARGFSILGALALFVLAGDRWLCRIDTNTCTLSGDGQHAASSATIHTWPGRLPPQPRAGHLDDSAIIYWLNEKRIPLQL